MEFKKDDSCTIQKSSYLLKALFYSVHFLGHSSSENRAYDRIANSEELLIKLFDESKMVAGKVYALMGLRNLNLELYKKYYMQIDSEEYITVRSGCFIFNEKIGDYLKKTDYFNKVK